MTLTTLRKQLIQSNSYWTVKKVDQVLSNIDEQYKQNSRYWRLNKKRSILKEILEVNRPADQLNLLFN